MPYADYQVTISPTALQGPNGAAFQRALGMTKDWLVRRLKAGVKCRMPLAALEDAVTSLGWERGLPRGISETPQAYAQRLVGAWATWQFAGTAKAILGQLQLAGYPGAAIAQANNAIFYLDREGAFQIGSLPSYDYSPLRWTFDQNWSQWSRFLVILPLPRVADPETGASWAPTTPLATNTSPSLSEVDKIRGIIAAWKSANAICWGIVAIWNGGLWGHVASNYDLPSWQPDTVYPPETFILPKTPNGFVYESNLSSGTSGNTEPVWPTVLGGVIYDNTCAWKAVDYAEGAGTWGDGTYWGGTSVEWSPTVGSTN